MKSGVLSKLRSPLSPRSTSNASDSFEDGSSRQLDRPVSLNVSSVEGRNVPSGSNHHRLPSRGQPKLSMPTESHNTPMEMIPVLSLLVAHAARIYKEGFLMVMPDLDNEGRPSADRQWNEVYAMLSGTQLAMWNAEALDNDETPTPVYHNVQDATMKSIASLPSANGSLENVIVISTTMKNRILLQLGSRNLFDEWTAALRLSMFERVSLQEAYTGAFLSSKGTRIHGVRALLGETKFKREERLSVRFGAGMPWKTVYSVLTPASQLKDKKERKAGYGRLELFEDKVAYKKGREPLATLLSANAAYAVFPERAVLMELSTLIQVDGDVRFKGENDVRENTVFIMPEQHPGVQGFETLIRCLIPLLDVFKLYGRPKRLNADKNDVNSLLFAMPTLPKAYYCDVTDIYLLTSIKGSENWTRADWMRNIKELLARKMAAGFRGVGDIHEVTNNSSRSSSQRTSLLAPPSFKLQEHKARAISDPPKIQGPFRQAPRPVGPPASAKVDSPLNPAHQRSASQGQNEDALIVPEGPGLLTPVVGGEDPETQERRESYASYKSAPSDTHLSTSSESPKRNNVSRPESQSLRSDDLFDPAYKPRHLSYGEYSDYVRYYTDPRSNPESSERINDSPTQVSAPRIGPYPRAPGSPRNDSGGLLEPPTSAQDRSQRRPSGPRPEPDTSQLSLNSSMYSDTSRTNSQSALASNTPQSEEKKQGHPRQGAPSGPRPGPSLPANPNGQQSQLPNPRLRPQVATSSQPAVSRAPPNPQVPYRPSPGHSDVAANPATVQSQLNAMNMYQQPQQRVQQQPVYQPMHPAQYQNPYHQPYQAPYQVSYQPSQPIYPANGVYQLYSNAVNSPQPQGHSPYMRQPTDLAPSGPPTGPPAGPPTGPPSGFYMQPYRTPTGPMVPGNAKTGPYMPGITTTGSSSPQGQPKQGNQRNKMMRATANTNSHDKGPYAL